MCVLRPIIPVIKININTMPKLSGAIFTFFPSRCSKSRNFYLYEALYLSLIKKFRENPKYSCFDEFPCGIL
jgi:hypothetical protein